jgi:hypothetical protein
MPTEQPRDIVDSKFAENLVHILLQNLIGLSITLKYNPTQVETLKSKIIEQFRSLGGVAKVKVELARLAQEQKDIGNLDNYDLTWLPEELK